MNATTALTIAAAAVTWSAATRAAHARDGAWSVEAELYDAQAAAPLTRAPLRAPHPGVLLGGRRQLARWWDMLSWSLGPSLTYLHHADIHHGWGLSATTALDLHAPFGLWSALELGGGLAYSLSTREVFRFEDGRYSSGGNTGRFGWRADIGLGLGYRLHDAWILGLRYRTMVRDAVPTVGVLLYSQLGLMVRWTL